MKKLAISLLLIAAGVVLLPLSSAQTSSFLVIVNPANPAGSMSRDQVSDLLLKKNTRWDHDNSLVMPIDLDGSSSVRADFSRQIHGRSVASIKNYWQRQIFSGRNAPPPEASSDSEAVSFVRANPGAIGYVSASASVSGVKTLRVSGER